jgi:hypothetical protein
MNISVLTLSVLLLVTLIAACLLPAAGDSTDDRGDGLASVVIPRHVKTPRWRPRTCGGTR